MDEKELKNQLNESLNFIDDKAQKERVINSVKDFVLNNKEVDHLKNKLSILYDYEKTYLNLIKEYKEEIKFANSLQEDLRRERAQFFTQTLREVSETMKKADVNTEVASEWIMELVNSYTKSLDLSGDLAKTNVFDIVGKLRGDTKKEVTSIKDTDSLKKRSTSNNNE